MPAGCYASASSLKRLDLAKKSRFVIVVVIVLARESRHFYVRGRMEMEHVFQIAVGTVAMRPYVFAFLVAYLAAAVLHLGWRTILWFTVAGYLISFVSEVSSINTGFPYGWYYYLD